MAEPAVKTCSAATADGRRQQQGAPPSTKTTRQLWLRLQREDLIYKKSREQDWLQNKNYQV